MFTSQCIIILHTKIAGICDFTHACKTKIIIATNTSVHDVDYSVHLFHIIILDYHYYSNRVANYNYTVPLIII